MIQEFESLTDKEKNSDSKYIYEFAESGERQGLA